MYKHFSWMFLVLLRQPAFWVATILFPSLFYLVFAVPESIDIQKSNFLLGSFTSFAFFGVTFLQMGTSMAQERSSSWHQFLRTLPISYSLLVLSKYICMLIFALIAAVLVNIFALIFTPSSLSYSTTFKLYFTLTLGSVAFLPMALTLGFLTNSRSVVPLGNMIYLLLSFMGGMWKPPQILPEIIREISFYLPTRHYSEVVWAVVTTDSIPLKSIMFLFIFCLIFSITASLGIKKGKQT